MKAGMIFLLLLVSCNVVAQKNERYCIVEMERSRFPFEEAVYISVDSGQAGFRNRKYVADAAGKRHNFVTEVRVLNYIGSLGWKIVPLQPVFENAVLIKGTFLFKKEE